MTEPTWVRQEKLTEELCREVRRQGFNTREEAADFIWRRVSNDLVSYISWILVVAQHREANRLPTLRRRAAERRRIRDLEQNQVSDEHADDSPDW